MGADSVALEGGPTPSTRQIASWQELRGWERERDERERLRKEAMSMDELEAMRRARRFHRLQLRELHEERLPRGAQAFAELLAMAVHGWARSGLTGSHARLAQVLGCSPAQVPHAARALAKRGVVRIVRLYRQHPEGFQDRDGVLRDKRQLANLYVAGPALLAILALASGAKNRARLVAHQGSQKMRPDRFAVSRKTANIPSQNQRHKERPTAARSQARPTASPEARRGRRSGAPPARSKRPADARRSAVVPRSEAPTHRRTPRLAPAPFAADGVHALLELTQRMLAGELTPEEHAAQVAALERRLQE